ncbi:OmpA family protein [Larkinella arboricola]
MRVFNVFAVAFVLIIQAVVCSGQGNPVEEYTVQIETKERSGQPVPATLTITNEATRKVQRGTLRSGSYTVALPAGGVYRLDATHTGYRPAQKILRLDRVVDPNQARQTIVLVMEREISSESPVNVTVIDYDTRQLIRQVLNVQIQEFDGKRVIMTGPPREGRFTFLAGFGQKVRFTVESAGYQPYTYVVDVKDQHDITIPLQRARNQVVAQAAPASETVPQSTAPTMNPPVATAPVTTAPPAAATPASTTPSPSTSASKPEGSDVPPATVNTDLSTLTSGKTVTLNKVYFDQSSYLLRPESYGQLNQLVALLKSRPGVQIEISGHTDNVGDPRLNLALSENRARVIMSYLVANGIAENRLRYKGYGPARPIAANDTEENKQKNRRVEVRLLE